MQEITQFKPKMHVFICINDRTKANSSKPSCGPKFLAEDVKEIKMWLLQQGIRDVQCTKTLCLGHCNEEGGVICIYPQQRFIKGLKDIDAIKKAILESYNSLNQTLI